MGERETRVALLRDKLATEQGQIAMARDQLARQRATTTDEELTAKAAAHAEELRRANVLVAGLSDELAGAAPDAVAAALGEATRRADAVAAATTRWPSRCER